MSNPEPTRNGLNPEHSERLAKLVRAQQGPAPLSIHTRSRWRGGLVVDARGERLELLDSSIDRTHHSSRNDLPPALGGEDEGPAPTETLLGAVAACVCSIFIEGATQHGIDVESLEVSTRGEIDLRGLFQTPGVRAGLSSITLTLDVRANADDETLEQLARAAVDLSPSAESLANPVPIQLHIRRLPPARS